MRAQLEHLAGYASGSLTLFPAMGFLTTPMARETCPTMGRGIMRLFISKDSKYHTGGSSSPGWMKSSLSTRNGSCVAVGGLGEDTIRVRDSTDARGAVLSFTLASGT